MTSSHITGWVNSFIIPTVITISPDKNQLNKKPLAVKRQVCYLFEDLLLTNSRYKFLPVIAHLWVRNFSWGH